MDSLHTIGFYVSAALSVAGGLSVAFLAGRSRRGLALGVAALGVAGIYLSLSAGFAAIVALVCYAGCGLLLAGSTYRVVEPALGGRWRQVGALAAAGLLAVLAYAAFRGAFTHVKFTGGPIGAAAVGSRLFAHDALATEAVAALVLVALVGAAAAWRRASRAGDAADRARDRSR